MRLSTAFLVLAGANTDRLSRLACRLASIASGKTRPRDAVRLVWCQWIAQILAIRRKYHVTDN